MKQVKNKLITVRVTEQDLMRLQHHRMLNKGTGTRFNLSDLIRQNISNFTLPSER